MNHRNWTLPRHLFPRCWVRAKGATNGWHPMAEVRPLVVRIEVDTSRLERALWMAQYALIKRRPCAADPNPFPRFRLFRRGNR